MNKNKTIERLIHNKPEAQLKELIFGLCKQFPDAYEYLLRWGKGEGADDINEELAVEYWEKAESIIDEFNQYGGGSDYEENEAYAYLESLEGLIPMLSWKRRQKIMDDMLVQYFRGNSGFDDILTDTCFKLCKEHEEWLYLAEQLIERGGNWDKRLVMNIYKIIGADEKFLELRKRELRYGSDYFELVDYYTNKGDKEKALAYAHKGLEQGEGRMDQIVPYLFNHYGNKDDSIELEKLFVSCDSMDKEKAYAAGRLYKYYKAKDNYENAKKYLIKEFDYIHSPKLDELFWNIKGYLNESDWQATHDKLFSDMKKRDKSAYMQR